MTTTSDHKVFTTDFSEFYLSWLPYVRTAVYGGGFQGADAEDLVADIFSELFIGRHLDKYDCEKAKFSTYIWSHVNFRIKGRRRQLWKLGQREFVADLTEGAHEPPMEDGNLDMAEMASVIDAVSAELQQLPSTESKNLARLFSDIVEQIRTTGEFSQKLLAEKYNISRQSINNHVHDLAITDTMIEFAEVLHG